MLAALSDYFVWWQAPIAVAFLMVWIFGGGTLLWVGGRFVAKVPKATYWRSMAAHILSGILGGVLLFMTSTISSMVGPPVAAVLARLVGLAASLIMVWIVIMLMLRTSFGKAILAWLPTLGTMIIAIPLWVSLLLPTLGRSGEMARQALCMANLKGIGTGIAIYAIENEDAYPPGFEALIDIQVVPRKMLQCPSANSGRDCDYFYLPPKDGMAADGKTIVACDFRDNHDGEGRGVLYVAGNVRWLSEEEFQEKLSKPINAAFAAALRAAEGP